MTILGKTSLVALLLFSLSSCLYKMPTDDTVDLRPTTNNPTVINEKEPSWMPGVNY